MSTFDVENLRKWFLVEQRDLPWRQNSTPYAVWVSEVMLQQTQVSVVIPYFERWMRQFPSIAHLACASLDEVIKAWEGLGYYSRARNLHAGARQVVADFGGVLPAQEAKLMTIKGLGPYTVGAIRAFAFRQKAAAVDGNVLRVLSRHDLIGDDIAKSRTVASMRVRTLQILPENEPWVISEALIELGATVCGRRPQCNICPLNKTCRAYAQGVVASYPVKTAKLKVTALYRTVVVAVAGDCCLVRREGSGKIMSDLHEFPYFETGIEGLSAAQLQAKLCHDFGMKLEDGSVLEQVRHGFTRYDVLLTPVVFTCAAAVSVPGYAWMRFDELDRLAFSSGHRRIYHMIRPPKL